MSDPKYLKPFWRYYGGKWRAAPRYPAPAHDTVIEPFAGAAGYSLRHYHKNIILVEKYDVVAEMWRYLIEAPPAEILRIPCVDSVDDLPSWVPDGGRSLVGFAMNAACVSPCRTLSSGRRAMRDAGRVYEGWSEAMRARVASQVGHIRHWRVVEGDYTLAPDMRATWFIDPPYEVQGKYYKHSKLDYPALAAWCKTRRGQVMVCENAGAEWLDFKTFASIRKSQMRGTGNLSHEVLWEREA